MENVKKEKKFFRYCDKIRKNPRGVICSHEEGCFLAR